MTIKRNIPKQFITYVLTIFQPIHGWTLNFTIFEHVYPIFFDISAANGVPTKR